MFRRSLVIGLGLFLLQSCMTFYERNLVYHQQFAQHDYVKANESLDKNKNIQKTKNQLLYFMEKGVTLQMMGNYEESNEYFEKAYIFIDEFQHSIGRDALSLVTNDMMRNYAGEDFERIFIHYYKAINYMMLNSPEEALVEAKRINIKLNEITDKYKSDEKYKRDAFAHVLMGLLYETTGDENNAFIAYRNAYEVYSEDYMRFFKTGAPKQLKKDLIRTAAQNGFYDSQEFYEAKFKMKLSDIPKAKKELIFIWHNGFGPVKDEWDINFIIVRGHGGLVIFKNDVLGISFSFYTRSNDEYNSLGDLRIIRVAFPKYTLRKQIYTGASVKYKDKEYPLELLENLNDIAVKSLKDRMMRELSKTLLRVALKQAAAAAARKEDEGFGAVISILNAVTEKADTRNWQTLPGQINYTRIPIESDSVKLSLFTFKGEHKMIEANIDVALKRRIGFALYHSISPEALAYKLK